MAPEDLKSLTKHFVDHSLSASTRKFYAIDFRIFATWCERYEFTSMPATPETIAHFLSSEARRGIKPATLTRRLAAIRMVHEVKDQGAPTQHKAVKAVMHGIKRQMKVALSKKAPATAERITKLKKLTFPKLPKRKKRQVRQKRPVFSHQKTSFGAGEKFKFIRN